MTILKIDLVEIFHCTNHNKHVRNGLWNTSSTLRPGLVSNLNFFWGATRKLRLFSIYNTFELFEQFDTDICDRSQNSPSKIEESTNS
jgi:hypothetical protein